MIPSDLDIYNPIQLYEKLLKEIIWKTRPINAKLKYSTPSIDISKGWVSCLMHVLKEASGKLLSLLEQENLSIHDFKNYLHRITTQSKIIDSIEKMVPDDCEEFIHKNNLSHDLLGLKEFFFLINKNLIDRSINAMMLCLDRDLRKLGIEPTHYIAMKSDGDHQVIFSRLLTELESTPLATEIYSALVYCTKTYPEDALSTSLIAAINQFESAKHFAETINAICIKHSCQRILYLEQSLDIPNTILDGFCSADIKLWCRREMPQLTGHVEYDVPIFQHSQVHNITDLSSRVKSQYLEEKSALSGEETTLEVISEPYRLSKYVVAGIKHIDADSLTPTQTQSIKLEAKKIIENAMRFYLESMRRHRTSSFSITLSQAGLSFDHAVGIKVSRIKGKLRIQYRDVNYGCFEFHSINQFQEWFADYFLLVQYYQTFHRYYFSYTAPLEYSSAYNWSIKQDINPQLKLAIFSLHNQNGANGDSIAGAMSIYRKITHPSELDRQQVIFFAIASGSHLIDTDLDTAMIYFAQAEAMIDESALSFSLENSLLVANVYILNSLSYSLKGNRDESVKYFQKHFEVMQNYSSKVPFSYIQKTEKLFEIIASGADISALRKVLEEIDLLMSCFFTVFQNKLNGILHSITQKPLKLIESGIKATYAYNFHILFREHVLSSHMASTTRTPDLLLLEDFPERREGPGKPMLRARL